MHMEVITARNTVVTSVTFNRSLWSATVVGTGDTHLKKQQEHAYNAKTWESNHRLKLRGISCPSCLP